MRIVSGPENKILSSLESVRIEQESNALRDSKSTAIGVKLITNTPKTPTKFGDPCLVVQIATADDLLIRGDHADVLFDHIQATSLRIYLNPSSSLRVWLEQARIEHLTLTSNASSTAGGNGKSNWLTLDSSQSSAKFLFHQMDADEIGVSAGTTNVQFSIRIRPGTHAGYYNPSPAPGKTALLYPIWIDGKMSDLEMPGGRVHPMPLIEALKQDVNMLRTAVLDRVGSQPVPSPAAEAPPVTAIGPSNRQRIADVLAAFLPAGIVLNDVQVLKNGGAIEGIAASKNAVMEFVSALSGAPDFSSAEMTYVTPLAGQFKFRALFNLMCIPENAALACKSKSGAYDQDLIRTKLLTLLGSELQLKTFKITGKDLFIQASGPEHQSTAFLNRIRSDAKWLRASGSQLGKESFWANLHLECTSTEPRQLKDLCQER